MLMLIQSTERKTVKDHIRDVYVTAKARDSVISKSLLFKDISRKKGSHQSPFAPA